MSSPDLDIAYHTKKSPAVGESPEKSFVKSRSKCKILLHLLLDFTKDFFAKNRKNTPLRAKGKI
jgi:hypothetical protein